MTFRSGFTSETHFSRSFRNRFAMSPRDARLRAREGLRPAGPTPGLGPRDWVQAMRRLHEAL